MDMHNIVFFHFFTSYLLQGLKFTPWCLDYWVDPSHSDQAVLTIGDIGGQVIHREEHCQGTSFLCIICTCSLLVYCFVTVCTCVCVCVIPGQCYIFHLGSDLSVWETQCEDGLRFSRRHPVGRAGQREASLLLHCDTPSAHTCLG